MNVQSEITKAVRGDFRRSLAVADAENALRASWDIDGLEDAWCLYADEFADESIERTYLLGVYLARLMELQA